MQYLNKQTTALREVNDSRLRIYEQVFIIVIIFIFIIYEQIFANQNFHLTDAKISLMSQYLHFIYLQPKISIISYFSIKYLLCAAGDLHCRHGESKQQVRLWHQTS